MSVAGAQKLSSLSAARAMTSKPAPTETYSPTHKRPIDDAAYWLDRAEELRTIADSMSHPDTRLMMLDLAQTYKEMADRAYQRAKNSQ